MLFFIKWLCMSRKNSPFPQTKSFPFTESFTLCSQKPLVFSTKTSLVRTTFYCPQKLPYHVQKPFFCTNLFLLSQATLFHPPSPISTSLSLLFAKNTSVLLLFALILCCKARTSHRFKSLPAIPEKVAAFRKTGYLMNAGFFS